LRPVDLTWSGVGGFSITLVKLEFECVRVVVGLFGLLRRCFNEMLDIGRVRKAREFVITGSGRDCL